MTDTPDTIISLRGISQQWDGRTVLSDINFDVHRGDFIAITGPNGGGKTTLLRIILKLLHPTTGTVTYLRDGKPTKSLSIGYLPQKNMIDSHFPVSVTEVVASGLLADRTLSARERARRVDEALDTVELRSHADSPIGTLSGGQLQRALLGRAIISRPNLLVFDEPLSYIDKHFESHLYGIIRTLAERATILLVSHEMTTIASMATRHLIVDRTIHECASRHHFGKSCDDE